MQYITPLMLAAVAAMLLSLIFRRMLYLAIPLTLLAGLYVYTAINLMLGYPTADIRDLQQPFRYLGHWGETPTFLLAVPETAAEPRLYRLDDLTRQARRQLGDAREKAEKGVPVKRRWFDGEFEKHELTPQDRVGPKE